tara:strand:+ start:94925 stop:95995 length:1071 start_codon:yes stop_codon:yes gene_type:complete
MNNKVIILTAYAGHGKDFALEQIQKIDNSYQKIAFADKFKEIISYNLPDEIRKQFPELSPIDLVNELKDNQPQIHITKNLNMRDFLRKMLGDTIRDIEPDIHCLYTIKKIEETLEKDPQAKFVCTDNRYVNEQDYLIKINQYKKNEEVIDFIRHSIKEKASKINIISANQIIDNNFPEKDNFLINIKKDFLKSINDLKLTKDPSKNINLFPNRSINLKNKSKEKVFNEYGVVGLFRPLVSEEVNPKNEKELISEIVNYTNLEKDEVLLIKEKYEKNCDLEFNIDNVKKYGFIRTSPFHLSESSLEDNDRKPDDIIINKPDSSGNLLYDNIFNLLNNQYLNKNNEMNKKKHLKNKCY